MPVIGIDQVPRNIARPSIWGDLGYMQGYQANKAVDALLAALLGGQGGGFGQVPTTPTPQRPGTLTFPSGATTPTSSLEMAQLQQMGGVPSRQGEIAPFGQPGTGQPSTGGVQYTQPTRFGMRPDVDFQLRQAQLQKAQQDLDPNSPVNQYLKSLTAANQPAPQGELSGEAGGFAASLGTLRQQADAGDEDAVTKIRLILPLLQGR